MFLFKNLTWRRIEPLVRKHISCVVLLMILLLIGCSQGENDTAGFVLEGKWVSPYDSYSITKTTVDYFSAGSEYGGETYPDTILKGNIEKHVTFTANAGVLIIKVTEASDYSYTVNKYTCVYYSEGTKNSIKLANPIGTAPDYAPIDVDSLSAAESLFTVDNVGTHVSMWGTYTK